MTIDATDYTQAFAANRYVQPGDIGDKPYPVLVHGIEGVKLENQVLITENGPIMLSRYPFEEELLV